MQQQRQEAWEEVNCGSTESNADVMATDVQQPDFPEDSADSGSGIDSGIAPQESGQSSVLPPLSTEAQTIDYKGNVHQQMEGSRR